MLAEEILKFGNAFREKDQDERTVAVPLTQRTVPCVALCRKMKSAGGRLLTSANIMCDYSAGATETIRPVP